MAFGRWTGLVQDALGNAVAGALVEVRLESNGALAVLYADREGTIGLSNPFTAAEATAFFHAGGGSYRVTAIKGGLQQIWRYVAVGTAGEADIEALQQQIADGLNNAVLTDEQELLPEAQEQARLNIGAASAEDVEEALDDAVRGDVSQAGKTLAWRQQVWANVKQSVVKLFDGTIAPGATALDIPLADFSFCKRVEIDFSLVPVASSADLYAYLSTNNAASFISAANSYRYRGVQVNASGAFFGGGSSNSPLINLTNAGGVVSNLADEGITGSLTLKRLFDATKKTMLAVDVEIIRQTGIDFYSSSSGFRAAAEVNNGVRLAFASGAIASGSYEVYGYV
jgi:hypothetical protein